MVIFKGECLNYEWTKGEIPNTTYGMSPQGWIDHELFAQWLLKLFIKNIPQTHPVLLLLDGHNTPEAIKIVAKNDIILFCLLPNVTHVAPPLDVSFFGPLKNTGPMYAIDICLIIQERFSSLLHEAWFQSIQPETIKSGF